MQEEWYNNLIEECQAIITETVYISRQALIEGKHQLGERICRDPYFRKLSGSRNATLKKIFEDIGIGRSEGYACVAFYEKFPKLSAGVERFTEQKNISWDKIKRNYLPVRKDKQEECTHENKITICRDCRIKINET